MIPDNNNIEPTGGKYIDLLIRSITAGVGKEEQAAHGTKGSPVGSLT